MTDAFTANQDRRETGLTGLAAILAGARRWAEPADEAQLDALGVRLGSRRLRVMVAGEAKRGKSSLINSLVGRDLLPTAVTPLTAHTTTVAAAGSREDERVELAYEDGRRVRVGLEDLSRYVTERATPADVAGLTDVLVRVHDRWLGEHAIELVDTPGTGSVHARNTADALRAFETLDVVILVLGIDPPISQAERDLLRRVTDRALETFVVLNKSDRHTDAEIAEAVAFTSTVVEQAAGLPLPVLVCSARRGPADAGFLALVGALTDYFEQRGRRDTDAALGGHVVRLLATMLESSRVRVRALELTERGDAAVIAELRARLSVIAAQRHVITDRCAGAARRLAQQLDGAASAATPAISGRVAALLDVAQDVTLASIATADLERVARERAEKWISADVEDWRTGEISQLLAGLRAVSQQARRDVAEQLDLVRAAVRDSLAIEVGTGWPEATLVSDPFFRLDFSARVSWDPPLVSLFSRIGTSERIRARTLRRVRADIPDLVDRQVGRTRADLHRGLDEGARDLAASLELQVRVLVDRVDAVLASVVDRASHADHDRLRAHETERLESLASLVAEAKGVSLDP
ncbi:MAG TPA: dynamin family protein [Candidatus Dormibacteraeota bacterium]